MMKHITKFISLGITLLLIIGIACGCSSNLSNSEDIFVVFTGDVHCKDDENIGYAGLTAYCDYLETKSKNVVLVDTGDFAQGDYNGIVSQGEYIIDLMNDVGYDYTVLGNHEFDYGMKQTTKLIKGLDADVLGCNISYTGNGENPLNQVKPYAIKKLGKYRIGFVGVSTPETVTTSTPSYFMEDGNYVINFDGEKLFETVQKNVDACKKDGADYVIVLSHLGDTDDNKPYTSREMIMATNGIDAVLDGHAHSTISCDILENKDGKEVYLSSTGTELTNIGTLVITKDGNISVGMVSDYGKKDAVIKDKIEKFNKQQEEKMSEKIATSSFALSISEDDIRVVRSRETGIGNLIADAYREHTGADIALANGGGIRADIPSGNITYGDLKNVLPYGNEIVMVKATGAEIADALEVGYCYTQSEYKKDGAANGESGAFFQISGIKCTIDTSIKSGVKFDQEGMLESITGDRRVSNIQILQKDGSYAALEKDRVYLVAGPNYTLAQNGDGINMFSDNEFVISQGVTDFQVLIDYINKLGGEIDASYKNTDGRIIVK